MNYFISLVDNCKTVLELIASRVFFDNSGTTLSSDNVQDALVELASATAPPAFKCFKAGNSSNVLPGSGISCAVAGDSSVI